MKDHTDCKRGFYWSSKAWYNKLNTSRNYRDIFFGMYHKEGGTTGEMKIQWIDLGLDKLVPQLECFEDGWSALSLFTDLIQKLGEVDDTCPSEQEIVNILLECGFEDLTSYSEEE